MFRLSSARLPGLALALLLGTASPALAGPPWISIEYPANPHDRVTRDALMVVHTYHHGGGHAFPVTGRAEGLVDGRRRSIPLELVPTSRPGALAVRGKLPAGQGWVVVLTLRTEGGSEASALVALGPDGTVGAAHVPARRSEGWTIPRAATAADLEQMLRLTDALAQARREVNLSAIPTERSVPAGLAAVGMLILLPPALALRRQRR